MSFSNATAENGASSTSEARLAAIAAADFSRGFQPTERAPRRIRGCVKTLPPRVVFSLAQPFHGWGIGQVEFPARFIGLPMMLKLKRETKPDESGSRTLSQPSQP